MSTDLEVQPQAVTLFGSSEPNAVVYAATEHATALAVKAANGRTYPSPLLRLFALREVDDTTGCWNFTGNLNSKGYGRFRVGGRLVVPHRFTYALFCGPIPEGHELDHLCRNRRCCNPFHCEPVTGQENVRRGWAARAREEADLEDEPSLAYEPPERDGE